MKIKSLVVAMAAVALLTPACRGGGQNNSSVESDSLSTGGKDYGVINVSVADARTGPDYAAEMATQLLLGSPVKLLAGDGWWNVETAEGYRAWITGSSLVAMTKEEFNEWIASPRIVFTDEGGFAWETPDDGGQRASDLVFGNTLRLVGDEGRFWKCSYPDQRVGYVLKSQSKPMDEWLATTEPTGESILAKALSLKGIPYSWGATSVKAMDCSGFTKTVMLMHGVILLRDASQQATTGIPVDINGGWENLMPGDLMFFGKKSPDGGADRIRHVAFYMGGGEFIHSAGYVKIGSLDSTKSNYDALNAREFIRARRIVGAIDTEGIWSINNNPLYGKQE